MTDQPPRPLPSSLAVSTVAAAAVAAMVLAFAVARSRDLLRLGTASLRSLPRTTIVDTLLPASILLGLPWLFGRYLDRAEHIDPIAFWRLVARGIPDAGLLVLGALLLRFLAGVLVLTRTGLAASRSRAPCARVAEPSPH